MDNTCKYEEFIQTSDNKFVLLESDIFTEIQTNNSLRNISRLFITQKILDLKGIDENTDSIENVLKLIEECNKGKRPSVNLKFGLTVRLNACEYTDNFVKSPFLEVLANTFKDKADSLPMQTIYRHIVRDIKDNYKYE